MRAPEPPLVVHAERVRLPAPLAALGRLAGAGTVLRLADPRGFRGRPWSVLATEPCDEIRVARWPAGSALAEVLGRLAPRPLRRQGPPVPFAGGWFGVLGYEARSGVEGRPPPRRDPLGLPAAWFGRYDAALLWDVRGGHAYAAGEGPDARTARARARRLLEGLRRGEDRARPVRTRAPRARTSRGRFLGCVETARDAIREGEIFQANLSHRFDARFDGRPVDLFRRLATLQPAPYATYVELEGGQAVLSASPERFLRVRGRLAETDPMKGTRPRGATAASDRRLRAELAGSEKERAELAMIVDLSRNDLGRVCLPGTVRVVVARRLLRFAAVHQAIGVVEGRLADGATSVDLLQAAFPAGSVTGAPKVRAMEILDAIEGEGRGAYCGAMGWIATDGALDLAVGIRTIVLSGSRASYRVGGGITLRSEPEAEWEETLAKGRRLFAALGGEDHP